MAEKIFYPDDFDVRAPLGIVLFNHAGSTVSQDTGRDARFLAKYFQVPVIGVDRPYSGYRIASKFVQNKLGRDYAGALAPLQSPIRQLCVSNDIRRLVFAGRSAGGTAAVVSAAAMELRGINLAGVYTAEMAGCGIAGNNSPESRAAARKSYRDYLDLQKQHQAENPALVKPEKPGLHAFAAARRATSILLAYPNDLYNHDQMWGSRVAIEATELLSETKPDTDVRIDFARDSAVASQQTIDILRTIDRIAVEQPRNTTHASFDNRRYFAERLSLIVDRVLFG